MRLARINLNEEIINYEEITENSKFFLLGARGLSSQIVHDEVPSKCDPFGQKNKLVIANGILTGSPFPNSGRTSIGGKSPLTGGIKEANVGGRSSIMMARHGIRAFVLEGKASNWKIIILDQNGVKIEDGDEYVGLGNYELCEKLYEKYGDRIGIYSIGPAGEHLMKASTVAVNDLEGYPSRHAARGGLGSVMGSKKVKAMIIIPPKKSKFNIKNIDDLRSIIKPFAKKLATTKETFSIYGTPMMIAAMSEYGGLPTKGFRKGAYDDAQKISGEKLHEMVTKRGGKKRLACSPTCVIRCSNLVVDEKGNHITSSLEYETIALNGSNLLINDLDIIARIDHACDNAGIDTIEFGASIGLAMDAGRIDWGDSKEIFKILNEIEDGTERGRLFGNGICHLANEIDYERVPHVKGQALSAYDPRVFKGMSVTFATSPMGADHTAGAAIAGRTARTGKDYGDLTDNEGKLDLSYELQIYTAILDSMGCCYFIGPAYETMELVADAINAIYGINLSRDDVIDIGKTILRNELDFNRKAGITDDFNKLPKFFRSEPSNPVELKVSIPEEELKNFWKDL
ncbi:MAG: aldehyde ferredoxin oxidoreductase [Candidatus Lokiarchaeota archaeon]|nr:aldehyde ferredoxin oxidoreductase [Candidatus Lokiarchaeota archaeon]MBD3199899.1 aldehyde ferredoxin oxidoreductase [Candidatus Lokiarchaeota archaeon]